MDTVKLRELTEEDKDKLSVAAYYGNAHTIKHLAPKGIDVTGIIDKSSSTLLHYAAWSGNNNNIIYLLRRGARVNDVDIMQDTPLHDAALCGHTESVVLLINNGANVNMKNKNNKTPLELAAEEGHSEIVNHFVKQLQMDVTKFDNETQQKISELLEKSEREQRYGTVDIRDLPSNIIKQYATQWEELGLELGLVEHDIAKISESYAHHPRRLKMCFTTMLQQWLKSFPFQTWSEVDDYMKEIRPLKVESYTQTNNLWTQHELEHIILTTKEDMPLPKDIEIEVLQSVMVLLVAVNINETLATHSYMQPLTGHDRVYQFLRVLDQDIQQSKVVIYYIGKFGSCTAAIRDVPPGFQTHGSVLVEADQCFPNVGTIISVGVAFGIKQKVKMCDVIVSSKIITKDKTGYKHGEFLSRVEGITVSPQLVKLFTQNVQWPNNAIKKRLNDNKIPIPNVKSGIILSGTYRSDDPVMKLALDKNIDPEAIGIEMEETQFHAETQQPMVTTIVVKAVCDFGDGIHSKTYQPTAALIAADLVHKCLSDPQAYEIFKGKMLLRQMLQQAKNDGLTINVRHAKILFCGASCAGKTSFSRLLRNQKHETVYKSTPAGDAQQVLISGRVNVEGTNWINLDSKLETQEVTKRLILKLQNQKDDRRDILPVNADSSLKPIPVVKNTTPKKVKLSNQIVASPAHTNIVGAAKLDLKGSMPESETFTAEGSKLSTWVDSASKLVTKNVQTTKLIGIEEQMVTFTDSISDNVPKTWDLFTLLDTGGQPEFINMLPAINSSTAITFVILNMSSGKECLNNSVLAQYKCEGYNYSKFSLKYTNIHLLKCLLSSIKVAAMKKGYFHADIIKKVTEDTQSQPIVCIIGTCADILKKQFGEKYSEEIYKINEEVKKLIETIEKEEVMVFWCDASGNYVIPIDNTASREPQKEVAKDQNMKAIQQETIQNIEIIRECSNDILRKKAQLEIPISWFILELELRNNDKVCIPLTEVQDICDRIMPLHRKMKIEEIKEVLKFYHLYGMLLYFGEVDGMKDFVITNPQWLFINLSKIIMCKFENNANDLYGAHHIKKVHNGICYMEFLERLKLDLQGIELQSFVKLLVHLKIIAPMVDNGYFIPTVLPPCNENISFSEEEYGNPAAFTLEGESICLEVEPLLIEFTFGTIPRGLFGLLIVQLLQYNLDFKLYGNNDHTLCRCADLITFYIKPCYYVSLRDRIFYLELQVRVKGNKPSCHYKVQTAVTEALKKVCDEFYWQFSDCCYGFLCCQHPKQSQGEHLTSLSSHPPFTDKIPEYSYCKSDQATPLGKAHTIWFENIQEISKLSGNTVKVDVTIKKIYLSFYEELVSSLPMHDSIFCAHLIDLFFGDLKNKVKSKSTPAEAATCFLDNVIGPAVDNGDKEPFNTLLSVMEKSGSIQLKNLTDKIKKQMRTCKTITVSPQAVMQLNVQQSKAILPSPIQHRIFSLEPRMYYLNKIVIPKVLTKWEDIAYELDYEVSTVQHIRNKHKANEKKCCIELFEDWLTTENGAKPKIWQTLLDKLKEIEELHTVTDDIIENLNKMDSQH